MSADGLQPARDRRKTDASSMAGSVVKSASIAGLCLIVASCSYRHGERTDAGGLDTATTASIQGDGEDRKEIEKAWEEEDRMVHEHLDAPGWIDPGAGIAHIPIDHAMDLIVLEKRSSGPKPAEPGITDRHEFDTALRRNGRQLLGKYGCDICHSPGADSHAPSLVGIYGELVRLNDGTFVRADEQYLRNSILHAGVQVVAGYAPTMPSYAAYIPEADVLELIAYLKSFKGTKDDPTAPP